ncbi:MAG: hypothetical protein LBE91_08125 [Tannerella sp.]|jgi:hypothetical protein|nr:hypothetical protein [Tannerella sp.]
MEVSYKDKHAIIKKVIHQIGTAIRKAETTDPKDWYVEGICDLIKDIISDTMDFGIVKTSDDFLRMINERYQIIQSILKDVQKINSIRFKEQEYYRPFSVLLPSEIQTVADLREWYGKRLEALRKVQSHYNKQMKHETG